MVVQFLIKTIIMMIQKVGSGAVWEDEVGYSRAIRIGNQIEVAGTTAIEDDEVVGKDDAYEQTRFILEKIRKALNEVGAGMGNVVRTRMYVTNIDEWELIGKAHGEVFRSIKPVATMVEVSRLIHPDLKVEIEVTAVLV